MMVEMKLSGLDGVLATLQSLPAEIVSKRGGPVLAALRKGAQVILAEEKKALDRVTSNATASGKKESTGLLAKSLTIKRGKPPSGGNGERVIVTTRRVMYPRKGKPVSVRKTGQLLEWGSSRQPAESWVRSSFNAKAGEAITTVESELVKRIDAIVAKLAAQNQGR
jgi:hypothetical protein